jgi:hypothetical protein
MSEVEEIVDVRPNQVQSSRNSDSDREKEKQGYDVVNVRATDKDVTYNTRFVILAR